MINIGYCNTSYIVVELTIQAGRYSSWQTNKKDNSCRTK